ncbi:MAG TPA: AarF/ABC1/UbiB kinase family protein [Solirubrobacteraceae bacterium]|nr:AarF/ABC1/UbiB kinase family protein [Solirubrobacteraceae bacterium]
MARESEKIPTSRVRRTATVASLAAGEAVKQFGTRAANVTRGEAASEEAMARRQLETAKQIVAALGTMKGAAMKLGQVMSFLDIGLVPEQHREEFQRELAKLRDAAPTVSFKQMKKVVEDDLEEPIDEVFASFDQQPIAAASIGQVYRATLHDGREVAVKVQYPGVAGAVRADMQNLEMIMRLLKRMTPALDVKAIAEEVKERIVEELDYELEAQNQRRIERLRRGHPFISVPAVNTELSTRRVLVSEFIEGERFEAVRRLDQRRRDSYGETVFRFYFGLLYRDRIALGDPHPGNYLVRPDGGVGFVDYGLLRDVTAARADTERAIARAVRAGDAAALKSALVAGAYLSSDGAELVDDELALKLMRRATRWYAVPGELRFSGEQGRRGRERRPVDEERQAEVKDQLSQFTLPAETILIRRMQAIVAVVLGQLRASADWGAIAAEYLHGEPPATPLGEAEAEYFARHGRPSRT